MADDKEPRRYRMPSEHTDDDRATKSRFGGDGYRPERDEYVDWRKRTLTEEFDDLALRERLLREQAEVLRIQAAGAQMDALDAVTVEQHDSHLRSIQDAWEEGTERPQPPGGSSTAVKWEAQADQLEHAADEIRQHLTQEAAA